MDSPIDFQFKTVLNGEETIVDKQYLIWCCDKVQNLSFNKALVWVGWIQGVCNSYGITTIDDERFRNIGR